MTFVDRLQDYLASAVALVLAATLAGCGGGSTSSTVITGPGVSDGTSVAEAHVDVPTGDNTTQVVVDSGPAGGFSIGAVNVPYVTVTLCTPGSTTNCITIDHVFLDTGSIGLRVLKSAVATLALPTVGVPADSARNTVAGTAVECYPFVLGAVWGPLATADLQIGGERASRLPVQLIDDATVPGHAVPAECLSASNGALMNTAAALQANGILGIGMLAYDCGLSCVNGDYSSGYTLYYSCPSGGACTAAALPVALQMQNPVTYFPVDNNGTLIALPKLPGLGAGLATGRLVFGIGTRANNQIAPSATMLFVDANPAHSSYLYFSTNVGSTAYPDSYIDSGSNAMFFADAAVSTACQNTTGSAASWYCPPVALHRSATLTDALGTTRTLAYDVTSADALFGSSSMAFNDLAGTVTAGSSSFIWGLPFFYGRTVYTSIWGQTLSPNGPWNAF
jgi:hypothetical protein